MSCCRALCGFSPKLAEQISSKLSEVNSVFPHSTLIVVLTPAGELLASHNGAAFQLADELLAPIASLKKSAVQFGGALNQMECPVIHIRGNHTMFSCYDVDKNVRRSSERREPFAIVACARPCRSACYRPWPLFMPAWQNGLTRTFASLRFVPCRCHVCSAAAVGLLLVDALVTARLVQFHGGRQQNELHHSGSQTAAAKPRALAALLHDPSRPAPRASSRRSLSVRHTPHCPLAPSLLHPSL